MDVRLFYEPGPAQIGSFDIDLANGDLKLGHDLETAVMISLFTDSRARKDDRLPDFTDDRRGWWGDTIADIQGDQLGSRLWLLSREKQTLETLNRAQEYAYEALKWLLDDGIASKIEVTAEYISMGIMGLEVIIHRFDTRDNFRFDYLWADNQFTVSGE